MREGTTRSGPGAAFGLTLLLLAMGLRALVPAGWMPAGDGLRIQPCVAWAAPKASMHHAAGHHEAPAPEPSRDTSCPFTTFASPALTAPEPWSAPALLPFLVAVAIAQPATVAIGRGLAAPPPPQTGPPLRL